MENEYSYLTDTVSMPLVIWNDKKLNPTEKILLVDIIGLVKNKACFKGNKGFSELVGLSKDRVSKILNDLHRRGYINIRIERSNESNQRKRTISLTKSFKEYVFRGLCFEETKIVDIGEDDSDGGIVENNYTGVSLKITRGYRQKQLGGIVKNNENKKSIEEVKEDIYADSFQKKPKQKKGFQKPTIDEVVEFFRSKGLNEIIAKKAFEHYDMADWKDSHGKPVVNWKQKMNTNWVSNNQDKQQYKYIENDLFSVGGNNDQSNWDDKMVM